MTTKNDHIGTWRQCLSIIKDNVNPQSYKTWFEPIKALKLESNILTIQVPSHFFYEWLEEHYVVLLQKSLSQILGAGAKLEYSVVVEHSTRSRNAYTINLPTNNNTKVMHNEVGMPLNLATNIKNPFVIPGIKKFNIDSQLNPKYTFDNLVEGPFNQLSRSAGLAVAAKPGTSSFNPLMIYGGCGLGKTHLLHAIGNKIKQTNKQQVVLYVSAEKFTQQFVESLRNNTSNDFVSFYQLIDVLLFDDVQFLSKKSKSQEMFFQIFNHLHQNDKQIVLTCDRPPKDLKDVTDRLLSRFKWGLSANIDDPKIESRVSILESKMHQNGIALNKDIIEYIAHNISTNVRELEGALISLIAHSSLTRKQVDLHLAKQVVKTLINNSSREISIDFIQKLVCDYYKIPVEIVKSKTRKREIVQARQIAMYFAKELTKSSLKNIGSHFGNRDHSTVIHACQTVNDLISTDKIYRQDVDDIEKKIKINTF